jgi:hypothetical protein
MANIAAASRHRNSVMGIFIPQKNRQSHLFDHFDVNKKSKKGLAEKVGK